MVKKEFLLSPWATVCKLKVSMSDHAGFFYLSRLHVFHLLSTMPSPTSFSLSSMPPYSHPHSCREHSLKRPLVRIQPDGDFAENISWWGFCREHNTIRLLLTFCSFRRDNAYSFYVISSRLQDVLNGLVRDTVWCSHPVPLMPPSILLTEFFLYGNVTVR